MKTDSLKSSISYRTPVTITIKIEHKNTVHTHSMLPKLLTMYDSEVSYFNYQFVSTPVTLQIRTQKYSSHSLHDV